MNRLSQYRLTKHKMNKPDKATIGEVRKRDFDEMKWFREREIYPIRFLAGLINNFTPPSAIERSYESSRVGYVRYGQPPLRNPALHEGSDEGTSPLPASQVDTTQQLRL